jgi:hypothetical protein
MLVFFSNFRTSKWVKIGTLFEKSREETKRKLPCYIKSGVLKTITNLTCKNAKINKHLF